MKLTWPEHPEVKGIFAGGCVARGEGSSFRARAHAHNLPSGRNFGWICVRSQKRLGEFSLAPVTGGGFDGELLKPSNDMLHELAHILTPEHGHDKKFYIKAIELGCRFWSRQKSSVAYRQARAQVRRQSQTLDDKIARIQKRINRFDTKVKLYATLRKKAERKLRRLQKEKQ